MAERLQDGVFERARASPDRPAVVDSEGTSTYGEIAALASRIARALRDAGVSQGDRGAILLPKSSDAVAALLGVLQADGIYLPLDPAAPALHTVKAVRRAEPSAILFSGETEETAGELHDLLVEDLSPRWIRLDRPPDDGGHPPADIDRSHLESLPPRPPDAESGPGDPAYLMFTSGSTGTPKGVLVAHRNATHFVGWSREYFGLSPTDRTSGHAPLHFDLSVFDIFATLSSGAQLHPVPPELNTFPNRLAGFIRDRELTQWFSVPAALKLMARFDVVEPGDFPALERILWCGEVLPTPVLRYWMERVPQATFTNLYGPTETTVASSYYTVPDIPEDDHTDVPIGRPCPGEELYVLDDDLEAVADGEMGDLYIGGAGVTEGYWRDPGKTEEAFRPAPPFARHEGRIYRTGDLATRDEDGLFHFHGRADRQIKSRGHRIELGEVESALHALQIIEDAGVVAVETDGFEGKRIGCAFVATRNEDCEPSDVRRRLSEVLPSYMLPSEWRRTSELPRNKNGKIDRPAIERWFSGDDGSGGPRSSTP